MMRAMQIYEKKRYGFRSKTEKWGVAKLPESQRESRLVLITGAGRSGTTSLAKMLTLAGLDVQHEKTGAHGTCSLFFAVDSDWHPMLPWYPGRNHVGERRSDFIFKNVFQVVRHPLKTIPSIGAIFNGLNYEYLEDNGVTPIIDGCPKLLRCAYAWHGLNKVAEEQADWRFKLEELHARWPELCKRLGLDPRTPMPQVHANKGTGYRKTDPTTWAALDELDHTLTKNIMKMAKRYGYEV